MGWGPDLLFRSNNRRLNDTTKANGRWFWLLYMVCLFLTTSYRLCFLPYYVEGIVDHDNHGLMILLHGCHLVLYQCSIHEHLRLMLIFLHIDVTINNE